MTTADSAATVASFTKEELAAHLTDIRLQLSSTLDAVEEKVNVAKRLDKAVARGKAKLRTMRRENPLGLAVLGAAAIAVTGLVAYAAFRSVTRR